MSITPEELINKIYKVKTFRDMNRKEFYAALLELIDGIEIIKDDQEYNDAVEQLRNLNLRKDFDLAITESEKNFYLKKLIIIGTKSNSVLPVLKSLTM